MATARNKGMLGALLPQTRQLVLRELVRSGEEWIHIHALARKAGIHAANAQRELRNLEAAGIVESKRVGGQVHFRLNPRCPIYPELKMLILKTVGLADVLCKALAPLAPKIKLAYIYGSFATGDTRADSDVDLMIVGKVTLKEAVGALMDASRTLSREVNPTVFSASEYKDEIEKGGGFTHRVHHGPKIMLLGEVNEAE